MNVIADTTVISNFVSIGQLDLLRKLYSRLYISMGVYEEIQAGLREGYQFYRGIDNILYRPSQTLKISKKRRLGNAS